jgi:hypothetical protein
MRVRRRSTRSRTSSTTSNGRAANGRRARTSGRTARRRRASNGNFAYDMWREQARPAIRQVARDWQSSPLFDVAEEIRVEVRDQIRNMIPDIVLREVRGVLDDVTNPNRRRRARAV